MGKSRRKFIKKEKAKVKLKSSKTVLPKGQNLTDTNFKVKKIVIKDQVKPHEKGELLSTTKLNVQVSTICFRFSVNVATVKCIVLPTFLSLFIGSFESARTPQC